MRLMPIVSFRLLLAKYASLYAQQKRAHIWCIIYPVVNIVHIEETGERIVQFYTFYHSCRLFHLTS
jgi:hypothetical protein